MAKIAFNVEDKGDHLLITVPKRDKPFQKTGGGTGKNVTIAYSQEKDVKIDGDRRVQCRSTFTHQRCLVNKY